MQEEKAAQQKEASYEKPAPHIMLRVPNLGLFCLRFRTGPFLLLLFNTVLGTTAREN